MVGRPREHALAEQDGADVGERLVRRQEERDDGAGAGAGDGEQRARRSRSSLEVESWSSRLVVAEWAFGSPVPTRPTPTPSADRGVLTIQAEHPPEERTTDSSEPPS